jgi:hypothetical protein
MRLSPSALNDFTLPLRNNMFELADRLVGIYKTHDATKSVTINPKLFEASCSGLASSSISMTENEYDRGDTSSTKGEGVGVHGGEGMQGKRALADLTNTVVSGK